LGLSMAREGRSEHLAGWRDAAAAAATAACGRGKWRRGEERQLVAGTAGAAARRAIGDCIVCSSGDERRRRDKLHDCLVACSSQ
jgi:hypothetical protein